MAIQTNNMSKQFLESSFQGAEWAEYTDFEFIWLETVLMCGAIKRPDLLSLLDAFGISLSQPDWREAAKLADLGDILINDVPKADLLPALDALLSKNYPDNLSRAEAEQLVAHLTQLKPEVLRKLCLRLNPAINRGLYGMDHRGTDSSAGSLARLIVEGIYRPGHESGS